MDAEIVERRLIYDRWSTISEFTLRLPNGAIEPRVVEDHGEAVAILLYDPDRRVALLITQPRAPVIAAGCAALREVVAGRVEDDDREATARAESREEAGISVGPLEWVATLWTMPAVSTERISLYLAAYSPADRTHPGGGAEDENECILIEEIALRTLADMVRSGALDDAKTFTLVQALMLRQPSLFD